MARDVKEHPWMQDPAEKPHRAQAPDLLNCRQELEEMERFQASDQAPITASETFKNNLKEKLWKLLKDKYYVLFALTALFFG